MVFTSIKHASTVTLIVAMTMTIYGPHNGYQGKQIGSSGAKLSIIALHLNDSLYYYHKKCKWEVGLMNFPFATGNGDVLRIHLLSTNMKQVH